MSFEIPSEVLSAAARRLSLSATAPDQPGVDALLDRLGLSDVPPVGRDTVATLLAIAARLRRVFVLPVPDAPGAVFVGAEVDPAAFARPRPNGPSVGVSGLGLTLRHAFEKCIGEAAEYLSLIRTGAEPVASAPFPGPPAVAPTVSWGHVETHWMRDGLGLDPACETSPLDWLPVRRMTDGAIGWLPVDLCLRRQLGAGERVTRPADSNGHAVAATDEGARLHALLEVVERDAAALWWFGRRPSRRVPESVLLAADLTGLLERLRTDSAGRVTRVLDLTTEFGVPVIAALSADANGSAIVAGVSARPDPASALCAAVLEMCQMEVAQRLSHLKLEQAGPRALNPQDRHVIDRARRLSWSDLPPNLPESDVGARVPADGGEAAVVDALARAGYTAVTGRSIAPSPGLAAATVSVPGLQSMRPDWVTQRLLDSNKTLNRKIAMPKRIPSIF